ncbi:MAG TPA: cytochrome c oxidase accessory protein CcoG [Leucothrix mucor]|nr:cytochrome c oxidase accessory protein CcoG [Leucothrix mucor]
MNESPIQYVEYSTAIQPRSVKGRFRSIKSYVIVIAYAVFFALPWLRWERAVGPDQALIFDLTTLRFYMFDFVVHPQDIYWLSILLFFAAVVLFFITTLAGRVFCGYFCFQTIWTDAYRWIEHTIQGDRVARLRLDKQGLTKEKIFKKGLTHFFWLSLSFWTALTFVLYWGNAPELLPNFFLGKAASAAYITTLILTATTYLAAGFARDAICRHVCPYSRFQSAMFDENTLIVSYDYNRGESKEGRAKPMKALKSLDDRKAANVGDCVDCGFCVQVCPMGIDIRDGLQIDCIHCALCIDACDNIMEKFGWDKGLISYTSENLLQNKKNKYFNIRSVGYGIASLISLGLLYISITSSALLNVSVSQTRQPLFVTMSDGKVQNSYNFSFINKTMKPAKLELALDGLADATISLGKIEGISIRADSALRLYVRVIRKPNAPNVQRNIPFRFKVTPIEGDLKEIVIIESQFITH